MSELYTAESDTEAGDTQGVADHELPPAADDDQSLEPVEPDDSYGELDEPQDASEEPDPVEPDDVDGADALESAEPMESVEPDESVEATDQVSEAVSHLEERKLTTDSGEAFYGQEDTEMRDMASKLEPEEGTFTVDLHGTPDSVEVDGRSVDAKELAAYLASDTSDWDGEPIRLMSCETGQGEEPFAQELADNLGVPVTAPTELAWSDAEGNSWVASGTFDEYGDMQSTWPPDGEWVTFQPNDKS
ncbi:hypothetical protein ACIPPS_29420 [Streptomyces sp. NPDC090127]|uniref:hypothetical protein n=1 Tax=Streptomyces sp. NPDC090127 TaxID=3365953 RepID=UPI0037FDCCCF